MKRGKRSAFTLMELLVVVAILAILAGLLLPVLARTRATARQTACLSNMRQLVTGHHLYLQDWDDQLPAWLWPGPHRPASPGPTPTWTFFLAPYLRSSGVYRDEGAAESPSGSTGTPSLADYVLLTWEWAGPSATAVNPHVRWPGPPLSLGQVVRPAETIQWMDGQTTASRTEGQPRRHGAGVNVAFVDGHARWMHERAFWRVEWDRRGFFWLYHGNADR